MSYVMTTGKSIMRHPGMLLAGIQEVTNCGYLLNPQQGEITTKQ